MPVHYGSTGLLALQKHRFLEAYEYHAWLLNNALELRIQVRFKGKSGTFHQADWDKKIDSHLRKLAKQHPWLNKVAHYDVEIYWDAGDGILRGKKKKTAGHISRDMARTLTLLMPEETKRKRGRVVVKLLLAHRIAVQHVLSSTNFGLGDFLAPSAPGFSFHELTLEAWKTPHLVITQDKCGAPSPLSNLPPSALLFEKVLASTPLPEDGAGSGRVYAGNNKLLMKRIVHADQTTMVVRGDAQLELDTGPDYILDALIQDCSRGI